MTSTRGVERDVTFDPDGGAPHPEIDQGYRTKYARFDPSYVEPMTGAPATATTLRLDPH